MRIVIVFLGCFLLSIGCSYAQYTRGVFVTVNPKIELLSIIQYLTEEAPSFPSAYSERVDTYFAKYKSHAAVSQLKILMNGKKQNVAAIASLGLYFSDFPTFEFQDNLALDDSLVFYVLCDRQEMKAFLRLCTQFAKDSQSAEFFEKNQVYYTQWTEGIRDKITDCYGEIKAIELFYQEEEAHRWQFYLSPLVGLYYAQAITMSKAYNRKNRSILIGFVDEKGLYKLKEPDFLHQNYGYLIWHEPSHYYSELTYIVYRERVLQLRKKLDPTFVSKSPIDDIYWLNEIDENIVRAITVVLNEKYRGEKAGKLTLRTEKKLGFKYIDLLLPALRDYCNHPDLYPTFVSFYPILLEKFEK